MDIYVINLAERTDRWAHMVQTFGSYFNLIRVDAIRHQKGAIGCTLSHKKCIQIAKDQGLNRIIVMEDDCIVNPHCNEDFLSRVHSVLTSLDNLPAWDIFLGACNSTQLHHVKSQNGPFLEVNTSHTTHFIIYNHTAYDFVLEIVVKTPIDCAWHHKLRAFTVVPFLAIANSHVKDRDEMLRRTELLLSSCYKK